MARSDHAFTAHDQDGEQEHLPPSKLGTKEHWDEVYEREVGVFEETGDEGEVWFGTTSVQKMLLWARTNLPPDPSRPISILECGCGNGTLLLAFLDPSPSAAGPSRDGGSGAEEERGTYTNSRFFGVDYSERSIELAKQVEAQRRARGWVADEDDEDDEYEHEAAEGEDNTRGTGKQDRSPEARASAVLGTGSISWHVVDLLAPLSAPPSSPHRPSDAPAWQTPHDLLLDKGTYDALALSSDPVQSDPKGRTPAEVYPERVAGLIKPGGYFLITSCNFTEEQIVARYAKQELGLSFHSTVKHASFSFGGKKGSTVCTVAFRKNS